MTASSQGIGKLIDGRTGTPEPWACQVGSIDQKISGRAELHLGPNDWPLLIPLVESNGHGIFDTKAGASIIVDRRIGRNELSAIRTLLVLR